MVIEAAVTKTLLSGICFDWIATVNPLVRVSTVLSVPASQ